VTGDGSFVDVDALAYMAGSLYVGGLFTTVDGQARSNIAHFGISPFVSAWGPIVDARVFALAVSPTRIYAAGGFANVSFQPRAGLASFDAAGLALTPWSEPIVLGNVLAVAASPYGVVAGGSFTAVGAEPLSNLAWFCP
jgi:hypothetical protein